MCGAEGIGNLYTFISVFLWIWNCSIKVKFWEKKKNITEVMLHNFQGYIINSYRVSAWPFLSWSGCFESKYHAVRKSKPLLEISQSNAFEQRNWGPSLTVTINNQTTECMSLQMIPVPNLWFFSLRLQRSQSIYKESPLCLFQCSDR